MNPTLNHDERLLLDAAQRYIQDRVVPLRKLYRDRPLPKLEIVEVLQGLAQFGYVGGAISEEDGGYGLSYALTGLLYEHLFKAFPAIGGIAFISSEAAQWIAEDGSPELKQHYLPGLVNGSQIGCVAITEAPVGSNPAEIQSTARIEGDTVVVNGRKLWISNGSISDVMIMLARTGEGKRGLSRFILERQDGYQAIDIEKMAMNEWPTSEIVVDHLRIPLSRILGSVGAGLRGTLKGFERARCYVAMISCGIAEAALDAAITYSRQREQWGKPIGAHQLVQELIADMAMMTEASRLLTLQGFTLLDRAERCDTQTSMAKAFATEAAVAVTSKALQVFGANGLARDYPIEQLYREARVLPIPDGTTQIQKLIIGRNLTGMSAF